MSARILVVDDNIPNLELALYLLRASGFEADAAIDGPSGLAALRKDSYDAVLVDVRMPGMDGYEFAKRVRTEGLHAATLVAVTALAMAEDRRRILASGFNGYIAKPIEPTTFANDVARLCNGHDSRR